MISAKPMAMVAMLALAGAAVAQEKADEQRERLAIPNPIELLETLPMHDLNLSVARFLPQVLEIEVAFQAALATVADTERLNALGQVDTTKLRAAEAIVASRDYRRGMWRGLLSLLASDYSRVRQMGRPVSVPMMQLLLLARVSKCTPTGNQLPTPNKKYVGEEDFRKMADELLPTPDGRPLALIYKLHEGNHEERIHAALDLGQLQDLAEKIVPHLLEELTDEDVRVAREAITALGMIGPAAKEAIPTLEKLTEHDDRQIAERAKAALRQVRDT